LSQWPVLVVQLFAITTLIITPFKKEDFAAYRYFLPIFTVDECKTRWQTIRDSYKKITKKMTGSAAPVKSIYSRDNLKFLDSCLPGRQM